MKKLEIEHLWESSLTLANSMNNMEDQAKSLERESLRLSFIYTKFLDKFIDGVLGFDYYEQLKEVRLKSGGFLVNEMYDVAHEAVQSGISYNKASKKIKDLVKKNT